MTHNRFKLGAYVCSLAILLFLNSALCFSEELAYPVEVKTDSTEKAEPLRESNGVVSQVTELRHSTSMIQGNQRLPLSDHKIEFVIQVKGDGSDWVSETDVTGDLEVRISYRFSETISTGGDRFVVVNTPMAAPMNWFSHCCPQHLWSLGIEGETYNVFNAMQDWITEDVLKLNAQSLPVGTYVFYYAYDRNPNSLPDFESLDLDWAVVHVKNPMSVSLTGNPISGTAPQEVTFQVIVDDPNEAMDTCSLVVGDKRYGCALYNKHTFTANGTYQAWAEVRDKYGREVKSNTVTITIEPRSNRPPTVSNLSVTPSQVSSYDEQFTINYYYDDPDGVDDVVEHHIGLGTSSLVYPAGGSGRFQKTYHFVEPSTPGTHYIDVYVVDSGGNRSNTLSDSVFFSGGPQPCGTHIEEGGDAAETHQIELGQSSGVFWFDYDTYDQEDQISIWYEGKMIKDFGCVGTNGTRSTQVLYSGSSTKVEVRVNPNCFGGTGTKWTFTLYCPLN